MSRGRQELVFVPSPSATIILDGGAPWWKWGHKSTRIPCHSRIEQPLRSPLQISRTSRSCRVPGAQHRLVASFCNTWFCCASSVPSCVSCSKRPDFSWRKEPHLHSKYYARNLSASQVPWCDQPFIRGSLKIADAQDGVYPVAVPFTSLQERYGLQRWLFVSHHFEKGTTTSSLPDAFRSSVATVFQFTEMGLQTGLVLVPFLWDPCLGHFPVKFIRKQPMWCYVGRVPAWLGEPSNTCMNERVLSKRVRFQLINELMCYKLTWPATRRFFQQLWFSIVPLNPTFIDS